VVIALVRQSYWLNTQMIVVSYDAVVVSSKLAASGMDRNALANQRLSLSHQPDAIKDEGRQGRSKR
jgi:hypothetical protein